MDDAAADALSAGTEHPGIRWGPFTTRIPFVHTGVTWPELLQGVFVAGATGLGLVPLLQAYFGLTFEESVTCVIIESILICSAPIIFGEPYASGWITPALPLVLLVLLAEPGGVPTYPTPAEKFQFMTAVSINFAVLLFILGATGLGRRLIKWLPPALKGGIIMGAAIAALKRVFVDSDYLSQQPVALLTSLTLCLALTFSAPVQKYKHRYRWLGLIAGLGLLPGFAAAALVGPFFDSPVPQVVQVQKVVDGAPVYDKAGDAVMVDKMVPKVDDAGEPVYDEGGEPVLVAETRTVKEVEYDLGWKGSTPTFDELILIPPFESFWKKCSPFYIGWPSPKMFLDTILLAFMGYVILFGDLITGTEVLRMAAPARPDEKIDINYNRSHFSLSIRNGLMALFAPFFPTQGCLWTGVQVIIAQRWSEGRKSMDSFYTGVSSYYVFGIPALYLALPLLMGLKPLLGIALSLTLVLTGFACAYIAMEIPKTQIERGVVILMAVTLAVFSQPWIGMLVGIVATALLVGFDREPVEPLEHDQPAE